MAITDRQVAAARAKVFVFDDDFERLHAQFTPDEAAEFWTLAEAATRLLIEYRCPRGGTRDEIIRLVGELRAKYRWRIESLDPLALEKYCHHLLAAEPPATCPSEPAWNLLRALVLDTGMKPLEFTDFLVRARQVADDWISKLSEPRKPKKSWWPWRR
jgi:hypothetical protein